MSDPSRSSVDDNPAAPSRQSALEPYDALLLVSFGGPERPEDVLPFLENVTRGRGIPAERLAEVGEHYFLFGGKSPLNDQCRTLLAALRGELAARDLSIPLYWGNRNWDPLLGPEVSAIAAAGHRQVLVVLTSAYPSYSSCRQYREDLFDAVGSSPVRVDKIRQYADHPGFVAPSVAATQAALGGLGDRAAEARLVFVTHSIPSAMAATSGPEPHSAEGAYVDWHRVVAASVTREVSARQGISYTHDLAYCSRSGPPGQPWLEPDINDHLRRLDADGVSAVVVVPIGFISDHLEVIFDLDTEAAATAKELGMSFARAATAGEHPGFVSGLVDLMLERAAARRGEQPLKPVVNGGEVGWYECQPDCCRNARDPGRAALCQADGPADRPLG